MLNENYIIEGEGQKLLSPCALIEFMGACVLIICFTFSSRRSLCHEAASKHNPTFKLVEMTDMTRNRNYDTFYSLR